MSAQEFLKGESSVAVLPVQIYHQILTHGHRQLARRAPSLTRAPISAEAQTRARIKQQQVLRRNPAYGNLKLRGSRVISSLSSAELSEQAAAGRLQSSGAALWQRLAARS